ncbi:MAG: hypothetical protein F9K19_20050 [Rhizobiaceae bacterium]|nr:MAG: hypothetical protein F9K19_20050 [Rhizobiaceae bacterium]CAG0994817.1 hypothetical protein RHIZO_02452 [Rhizobiaceae bacterium]
MPSSDFRQIAERSLPARTDRLFRAAVSAYCALPRPSRRETVQLEDLVLPLFDSVSAESRRYVAAVLSELPSPPATLVRRLCEQPVDVAAPLLIRSPALTDIDLLAVISRHGLAHARAIERRKDLNPAIANLIRVLDRTKRMEEAPPPEPADGEAHQEEQSPAMADTDLPQTPADLPARTRAEDVRDRLRSMMLPAGDLAPLSALPAEERMPRSGAYDRLRATALTGNAAFFHTALADALGIGFRQAKAIASSSTYADLAMALRALGIDTEGALLIVLAAYPSMFGHAESVRLFVDRYELCHREKARDRLRGWRAETLADAMAGAPAIKSGANGNKPDSDSRLRAS